MIKQLAITALLSVTAMSANAAPQWVELPHSLADASFLDRQSIDTRGEMVNVSVLRNFDQTIVLGNDPVSGEAMYPHRSVNINYLVDCSSGKLALAGWKMFNGNYGNGEVVWADRNWGEPVFVAAADAESRAVMNAACATAVAAR